jgi:hypothetical protein
MGIWYNISEKRRAEAQVTEAVPSGFCAISLRGVSDEL